MNKNNEGQDLLYSDDEESSNGNHHESTILLSHLPRDQMTDRPHIGHSSPSSSMDEQRSDYGSMNSTTSSLGNSDYDRRESYYRNDRGAIPTTFSGRGIKTSNLKTGGMLLTGEENRTVTSILLAVVLTCAFSVVFLAGSAPGVIHGGGGNGGSGSTENRMHYFPFPNGSMFSAEGGISASLETSRYVPFKTIDRKDMSMPASEIVFPALFHSSLQVLKNSTKRSASSPMDNDENSDHLSSAMPLLKVPFPTGAFWTNLVIAPTSDRGFSYPIMCYPYAYKWNPSILQISYPPLRRLTDKISIRDIFNPDMAFSTEETIVKRNVVRFDPLSVTLRFYSTQVNSHEERTGSDPDPRSSYWESYLVQGSPYVTAKFNDMTPIFTPLSVFQNFVCPRDANGNYKDDPSDPSSKSVNSTNSQVFGICMRLEEMGSQSVTLYGVQFLAQTQENLTWMIFSSEPITLTLDLSKRTIRSVNKYTGIIRFALVPPPLHDDVLQKKGNQYESILLAESSGVKRLIYHAHTYPIGAKVSWEFQDIPTSSTNQVLNSNHKDLLHGVQEMPQDLTVGTVNFAFQVKSMNSDDSTNFSSQIVGNTLLMLALPHHTQVLASNMILNEFDLEYQCIKGVMKPIIGSKWSYFEHLTDLSFDSEQDIHRLQNLSFEQAQVILKQVELDLGRVLPTLTENVYGFGKQIARLAQLCHIASILEPTSSQNTNDTHSAFVSKILTNRATSMLHDFLTKFLDGSSTDNLLYDINFGGIITRNGVLNMQEDFGNGWYNDHHFHYGYILYAASILGRLNSTFVDMYGIHVDSILYDVAHGANDSSDISGDAFFPFTRHKSWFDGHSFASGLFPFADGKSQESSSEAINCYYGAYLWSLVRWNDDVERINFAKLLLAMEIRGAKTYWHMEPQSEIDGSDNIRVVPLYNQEFRQGLMIGNLGMMDVTVATWFGTQQLYVHMINFMPVTSITKELFSKSYIEKEFNDVIKPIFDDVEMAWRGYTISDKALVYPTDAWNDATKLRSYELDSALSQSQVYFWIASMNGFNASVILDESSNDSPSGHMSESASCDNHQGCALLQLQGVCCPTGDGIMLGCCD